MGFGGAADGTERNNKQKRILLPLFYVALQKSEVPLRGKQKKACGVANHGDHGPVRRTDRCDVRAIRHWRMGATSTLRLRT